MSTIKRGAFKGKKVTFASTDRVEEFRKLAADFMIELFDFLPGDYLITDESSLRDFTDFSSSDTAPLWRRITEIYAIGSADVPSEMAGGHLCRDPGAAERAVAGTPQQGAGTMHFDEPDDFPRRSLSLLLLLSRGDSHARSRARHRWRGEVLAGTKNRTGAEPRFEHAANQCCPSTDSGARR